MINSINIYLFLISLFMMTDKPRLIFKTAWFESGLFGKKDESV